MKIRLNSYEIKKINIKKNIEERDVINKII